MSKEAKNGEEVVPSNPVSGNESAPGGSISDGQSPAAGAAANAEVAGTAVDIPQAPAGAVSGDDADVSVAALVPPAPEARGETGEPGPGTTPPGLDPEVPADEGAGGQQPPEGGDPDTPDQADAASTDAEEKEPAAAEITAGKRLRWQVLYCAGGAASQFNALVHAGEGEISMPAWADELTDILEISPDAGLDVVRDFLVANNAVPDDVTEAAVAFIRAAYVGMLDWIRAEEARLAPMPEPVLRRAGYEKSGREEPAGAKNVSAAERKRLIANKKAARRGAPSA